MDWVAWRAAVGDDLYGGYGTLCYPPRFPKKHSERDEMETTEQALASARVEIVKLADENRLLHRTVVRLEGLVAERYAPNVEYVSPHRYDNFEEWAKIQPAPKEPV